MCDECHKHHHATMCPNGTPMVDVIYAECVLCGAEEDETEIYYGICEKCWAESHTLKNALAYGDNHRVATSINGLFEKLLSPEQINAALYTAVADMLMVYNNFTLKSVQEFLSDDDGDFADWLKEQKNID